MDKKIYLAGIFLVFCLTNPVVNADYDILIKNAKVFDGSLIDAFRADVAINGDRIVKVAQSITGKAKRMIDAEGLTISLGFIDMHTHSDLFYPENRSSLNYLKQGVTTIAVGLDGRSG